MVRTATKLLLLTLVLVVGSGLGAAQDDARRARPTRPELRKLLDRELSIIETLEGLQFAIVEKEQELEEVQKERRGVEGELDVLSERVATERASLDKRRDAVRKRLRAMRQIARFETLHLVFASKSFTDYMRREDLLERLLDRDRVRIDEYREALASFREEEAALRAKHEELAALETTIQSTRAALEKDRRDHEEILRTVDEDREFYEKYHRELRRRSRLVERKIAELDAWDGLGWFESKKGKLKRPVNHVVTAVAYGYRVHPRFKTRVLHRGITFRPARVPEGVSRLGVRCVYQGKVIYAGWLSGYGKTVIVDHTKGYYTVYSRLSRITVDKDEVLKTRERLGFIGGGRRGLRGAELYFELRENGRPVDPGPWLQ